jgi:hypothetical protein
VLLPESAVSAAPRRCIRCHILPFRHNAGVRHGGRGGDHIVQNAEHCGRRAGRQQRHAEFLILVRRGNILVPACMDAGCDAQHDLGAFAEIVCDGSDAGRLARLIDDDFGEALLDGERDLLVGLVIAMQHQPPARNPCGKRMRISPIEHVSTNMPAWATMRTTSLDRKALPA